MGGGSQNPSARAEVAGVCHDGSREEKSVESSDFGREERGYPVAMREKKGLEKGTYLDTHQTTA